MDKERVLILGKGFIGSRLQEFLGCKISDKKIFTFRDADEEIKRYSPKAVINCIGYTGRNVDECELEKEKTLTSNSFVPLMIAEAAIRNNCRLIHLSSGCIYHYDYSQQPITEDKIPDFFGLFYSRSKIYSERALETLSSKYPVLILRIRIPLDSRPHPKNILDKLIKYKKVIDIPNSLTYIPDFIEAIKHFLDSDCRGIYNVVNKGALRYPELMEVYKKYKPEFQYEIIDYKKLGLVRTNLVLSTEKLERSGFKIRPINEVLDECVKNYLKY
ncbi:MAG: sugar nucleotide-binding protein [Candidatus Omnitrophota bacterium]